LVLPGFSGVPPIGAAAEACRKSPNPLKDTANTHALANNIFLFIFPPRWLMRLGIAFILAHLDQKISRKVLYFPDYSSGSAQFPPYLVFAASANISNVLPLEPAIIEWLSAASQIKRIGGATGCRGAG